MFYLRVVTCLNSTRCLTKSGCIQKNALCLVRSDDNSKNKILRLTRITLS